MVSADGRRAGAGPITFHLARGTSLTYRFDVTSCLVLTSRAMPGDSGLRAGSGRSWTATIFAWLLSVLAIDPVQDLVKSVDRMPIRSLLELGREPQPDAAWTIDRVRLAPPPTAIGHANPCDHSRVLGTNDHTMSRAPCVAESPTQRTSATRDETRAIDQCGAARNSRRYFGGRRAG